MGMAEIRKALGLHDRKSVTLVYLKPAIELELVEMSIPDKPKSSRQKYRTTEKAQQLLKADDAHE
jgi:hypothetical protein